MTDRRSRRQSRAPPGPSTTPSACRSPTCPATVLPGAVITLALATDAAAPGRSRAARASVDGRVVLRAGDNPLGVVAQVPDIGALPTGEPAAIVRVEPRARILAVHASERGATYADVELVRDPRPTPRVEALGRELRVVLEAIAELRRSRRLPELLRTAPRPGALADAVATWAELDEDRRREVLAADRRRPTASSSCCAWARDHLAELQVAESIRNDVTEGVDKQQREYLLRQQLAAIRKELGEGDDDVVGEYRTQLDALDAPEAVKNALAKELDRLERTSAQSPEQSWIRTWLDRVFELPWGDRSDDTLDLAAAQRGPRRRPLRPRRREGPHRRVPRRAQAAAERDTTSTDDARRRASADVAAARARSSRSSVLPASARPASASRSPGRWAASSCASPSAACATRPRSAATAAPTSAPSPGRIVRAITEAGTMNPVMLLDEVDKLGVGGWSGDPTAALLEVLDPAQNHTFRDHYLEVDLDLSEVVFIATAERARHDPGAAARPDGPRPPRRLHRRREGVHRPPLPAAAAAGAGRARRRTS